MERWYRSCCRDAVGGEGRKTTLASQPCGPFAGEVLSDLAQRPEGMRIRYRRNRNSIRMYDLQGSVLRVENDVERTHCS